jgi:pyruvate, water dikinase
MRGHWAAVVGLTALGAAFGCPSDAPIAEDTETGEATATTAGSSSSGGPGLCVEGACGALAHCDPVDGRCYCDPGAHGDANEGCAPQGDVCGDAALRVGKHVCEAEIDDAETWETISIGYGKRKDVRKLGKYLAPADGRAPLPTLFNDANVYRLHYCMLRDAFQPQLPGFTYAQYNALVYYREDRTMYAGNVYEFSADDVATKFGFTVETPEDSSELLTQEEVYGIYRHIQDRLALGDLGYVPNSPAQQALALSWDDPPVPVVLGGSANVSYEAYTIGTTYGRVRLYDSAEATTAAGTFGWQDLLVLESVPSDFSGVMAGTITGSRQDVLSHLNVLAGQRGTPNVFVATPLVALRPFEGKLVKLVATPDIYTIEEAAPAEAEAFWAANRPSVTVDHPPDATYAELVDVLEIPTSSASERGEAVGRFGGKVTGLATMYATLDPAYQADAFGVPVKHYLDFMAANTWEVIVDGTPLTISFADTITMWLADPKFTSDTAVRRAWLSALQAAIVQKGQVDAAVVTDIGAKVGEVFGSQKAMVRLRSSSNVEDGVEFNGAGLYTSVSACALDPVGAGGSSACDPDKKRKSVAEGLKAVWASVWNFGAYEEREYYQVDQTAVAMGVLVSTQYEDEQANGVVFTGNPNDFNDDRFTVNVQVGEIEVVNPPVGTTAELVRLTIMDGAVSAIERVAPSSEVPAGEVVLTDFQLIELGGVVDAVKQAYPVEYGEHAPSDVLLDLEFKIVGGKLIIKQVRPFLRSLVDPALPSCI